MSLFNKESLIKLIKRLLISIFVTQVFLVFYAVFGDILDLLGVKVILAIFSTLSILFGLINVASNLLEKLTQLSFSTLILINMFAFFFVVAFMEEIMTMLRESWLKSRKRIGRKISGDGDYVLD